MPEGDTVWNTARVLERALLGEVLTGSDFRVPQLATTVGMYRTGKGGTELSMTNIGGYQEITGGTVPVRICGAHQNRALAANIPGRRNVRPIPEPSTKRSSSACSTATGLVRCS